MSHTKEYNTIMEEDVESIDPITRKGLGLGLASGGLGGPLGVAGMATGLSGSAVTASILLTVSAALSGGMIAIPIAGFLLAKGVRKVQKVKAKRQQKKLAKEAKRQ